MRGAAAELDTNKWNKGRKQRIRGEEEEEEEECTLVNVGGLVGSPGIGKGLISKASEVKVVVGMYLRA